MKATRTGAVLLLVLLGLAVSPAARGDDQDEGGFKRDSDGLIDIASFAVDEITNYLEGKFDKAIARERKILSDPNASASARAQAKKKIEGFGKMKVWVGDPKAVKDYAILVKDACGDINDIYKDYKKFVENKPVWNTTSVLLVEMDTKKLSTWTKGIDTGIKAWRLYDEIKGVEAYEYNDAVQGTVKWMKFASGLTSMVMGSDWIGKVPGFGSVVTAIIGGYADVALEFVNAVNRTCKKLDEFDQGYLGTGSHGLGRLRNTAWNQQGMGGLIARIPGLRDLYEDAESRGLFLWDKDSSREVKVGGKTVKLKGRWWDLSVVMPGVGLEELRSRYLTFYRVGNRNPSAQDILKGYRKLVWIKPVIETPAVVPGAILKVRPTVIRVHDRKSVKNAWCVLSDPDRKGSERQVRTGEVIEWKAPETPGKHRLVLILDPALKGVWFASGKGESTYWTGGPTKTRISARPREILTNRTEPVDLYLTVKGDAGRLVEEGIVYLRSEPPTGIFSRPTGRDGLLPKSAYHARDQVRTNGLRIKWEPVGGIRPGLLHLVAEYEGSRSLDDGLYITPSKDLVTLKAFRSVTPVLKVKKKSIQGGWALKVAAFDSQGKRIREGSLELMTPLGRLEVPNGPAGDKIKVPSGDARVRWREAPGGGGGKVLVRFLEHKSEATFTWYQEARLEVELPASAAVVPPPASKDDASADLGDPEVKDLPEGPPTNPPPRVDWNLKFGVGPPSRPEPKVKDDRPTKIPPPPDEEKLDGIAFQWGRGSNTGLPLAPLPDDVEMGEEGRPPTSGSQRQMYELFDAKFMRATIPAGAKARKPDVVDGLRMVRYFVGDEYVGQRTFKGNEVVELWPIRNGMVHGGLLQAFQLGGMWVRCIAYRENGQPRVGRVYVDDKVLLEAVVISDDPPLTRYTAFDHKVLVGHQVRYQIRHQAIYRSRIPFLDSYGTAETIRASGLKAIPDWEEKNRKGTEGLVQTWEPGQDFLSYESFSEDGVLRWERSYFTNGNVEREATFDEKAELHGFVRLWQVGGEPLREEAWHHGKRHGRWREWTDKGTPVLLMYDRFYEEGRLVRVVWYCEHDPAHAKLHVPCKMEERGPDGELVREISWFPDQTCKFYRSYKDDKAHGLTWLFHPNGRLKVVTPHRVGKKEGNARAYRENGRLEKITPYRGGKINGEVVIWGESGRLIEKIRYSDDKKQGQAVQWDDETGAIEFRTLYQDGVKHGTQTKYSLSTGLPLREIPYKKGILQGTEAQYDGHGNKTAELPYVQGKLHGLARYWGGSTGKLKAETEYAKGEMHGKRTVYGWDGKVAKVESYRAGKMHGRQVHYRNGAIQFEAEYRDGQRIK